MFLSNVPVLVAKAAFAVMIAFIAARLLVPRDLLSATFVSMLCISPTLYTGLRRGFAQVVASALGGLATLAVMIPFGLDPLTLFVSVALGLGAAFVVGFTTTYTVAGFTVLYVALIGRAELDAYFVRLASVLLGVGAGTLANFVASAFWYQRIFGRRVAIAARVVARPMGLLAEAARTGEPDQLRRADDAWDPVFRLLADLSSEFKDLRRELRLRRDWRGERLRALLLQERIVERLGLIAHYGRDLALLLRELHREPEGAEDAAAVDVPRALEELRSAVAACAARLAGEEVVLPATGRTRFDPMLRKVAGRVADGESQGERLDLMLGILVDLDNLFSATSRLVERVEELRPLGKT